ncbi:DUF4382 domain-containing protein [Winogradskyella litoriviva]|uniref:DUF4382 domain-containing protein n=1 Tax=Winogradskyella litoriviva TaxID=1220182 RepID=A0ABX2E7H8_9FLAO|nr:DUF4382 domain-containing protein [Winogradskyella litoriviva]NRD24481.1 DUF4382 domain-containing protein [Winogradskyella litoriviva]
MKHLQALKLCIVAFIFLGNFTSCSKEDLGRNGEYAGVTVSLKSLSTQNSDLFLEIEDVQVKIKDLEGSTDAWLSLNAINTGTHNISDLIVDSELLLVDHFEIQPAYIYEVRLVLGDNNFINENDVLVSLDVSENGNLTPSNLVNREFEGNYLYDIIIELDIDQSINFNDDQNTMVLNPKLYTEIRKF